MREDVFVGVGTYIYNMQRVQCEKFEQKIYDKNRHPSLRHKNCMRTNASSILYRIHETRGKRMTMGEKKKCVRRRRHRCTAADTRVGNNNIIIHGRCVRKYQHIIYDV